MEMLRDDSRNLVHPLRKVEGASKKRNKTHWNAEQEHRCRFDLVISLPQ